MSTIMSTIMSTYRQSYADKVICKLEAIFTIYTQDTRNTRAQRLYQFHITINTH